MNNQTKYTVTILRAGQPRPYADSEYEYLITVENLETYGRDQGKMKPWLMLGDVEARILKEEAWRKAGTMSGGYGPEELRKQQRDWAKKIITALCQSFREPNDDDGKTGADAHFAPTLKRLTLDPKAGTIRALIVCAYTD
jgi:hypothetical protein